MTDIWSGVWEVPGTVVRVIDGDTFVANLDLGWSTTREDQHIRVLAINAPEVRGDEKVSGDAAKAYAETLLPAGAQVTVLSHELDDFGRTLATVTLPDGRDLGQAMLDAGQAVPYTP